MMDSPQDPPSHDPSGPSDPPIFQSADVLPPVQPPAASFIIQLFLIPMLIVTSIVVVWLMFSWLAQMGTKPEELIADIERLNHSSWQKALTLANTLQDKRQTEVRTSQPMANRLAEILQRQIDQADMSDEHLKLRMYLCRALGEFEIDNGIPVLIEAATTERDPKELNVRRAAIQSIGQLAHQLGSERLVANDALLPALFAAAAATTDNSDSKVDADRLRSTSAFVLGLFDTEESREQLVHLLSDANSDVRYNATTSLARLGDERAVSGLLQMLDPQNVVSSADETKPNDQRWKQHLVVDTGLDAVVHLVQKNRSVDSSTLKSALKKLANADLGADLSVKSKEVLGLIDRQ